MKWVEREVGVDTELVSLNPLTFEHTREPRILPAERCLYTCKCGVTVGPEWEISHVENHGKEAPPEQLAGMVQPASETQGTVGGSPTNACQIYGRWGVGGALKVNYTQSNPSF